MAPQGQLIPSSIDTGFQLSLPQLDNPFTSDVTFQRVISWFLPPDVVKVVQPSLIKFGDEAVSEEIHDLIGNAESETPYVKAYDVWGKRYPYDKLITSKGWKELGKWGARNGVISLGYEPQYGQYRRIVQHAHNYIYSASSAVYSCPVSMTSGAARLFTHIVKTLPSHHPFHEILSKITAREGHWVSSQWMTERPGGSDVQNSETVARYAPLSSKIGEFGKIDEGDYLLTGFKFFCSATDCNICLMLARTESGQLSLFVAPVRKNIIGPDGKSREVTNGIRIHRLKNKMGTKELPTAEVELRDVRAHLVGPLDRGVATIALLLNVTRTHNFITALSCWRRAMFIAKSFAKHRTTIDQPLWTFPMHLRLLATMEVKHRGCLQLCFFTTALLSFVDNGFPENLPADYATMPRPGEEAEVVLRTFTATAKAIACKVATISLQECQEALGGVGYMDEPLEPEYNIARLMRDTAANMTWEGTTNVLSSEVVRHLLNRNHLDVFSNWLFRAINSIKDEQMRKALAQSWSTLRQRLTNKKNAIAAVLAEGRQIMFTLGWIVCGTLLALDSQRDADEIAIEVANRWILDGEGGVGEFVMPDIVYANSLLRSQTEAGRANWDCRLVWGQDLPQDAATGYRASGIRSRL